MRCSNTDAVMRELENWGGSYSSFGYRMKRTAETFFPVFEKDGSYAMFEKCCEMHVLNAEQRRITRECLERNGFEEIKKLEEEVKPKQDCLKYQRCRHHKCTHCQDYEV